MKRLLYPLMFAAACHANHVPVELHVYEHGPHGFGLGGNNPVLSAWPAQCAAWMRARGRWPPLVLIFSRPFRDTASASADGAVDEPWEAELRGQSPERQQRDDAQADHHATMSDGEITEEPGKVGHEKRWIDGNIEDAGDERQPGLLESPKRP